MDREEKLQVERDEQLAKERAMLVDTLKDGIKQLAMTGTPEAQERFV